MRLTYFYIKNSKSKISILVKLINKFWGDFKETFTILNNYTLMHLLNNAIDAIEEGVGNQSSTPQIRIHAEVIDLNMVNNCDR